MKPYDLYAFVTETMWNESLQHEWDYDAPSVSGYRLLVFSSDNIPSIELVELEVEQVIEAMTAGNDSAFMCDINQAREVVAHFTPPDIRE